MKSVQLSTSIQFFTSMQLFTSIQLFTITLRLICKLCSQYQINVSFHKKVYTQKQTESSSIFHDHNMKVENQTGKSLPDPNVLVVTADRAKG